MTYSIKYFFFYIENMCISVKNLVMDFYFVIYFKIIGVLTLLKTISLSLIFYNSRNIKFK